VAGSVSSQAFHHSWSQSSLVRNVPGDGGGQTYSTVKEVRIPS
jgi:hypothetical protein